MEKLSKILSEVRNRISKNELELAFQSLFDFVSEERKDSLDDLILLSKRYYKLRREKLLRIISYENADVAESKLTFDILIFIQGFEEINEVISGTKKKENGQIEILIEGELEDFNTTRKENLINTVAAILNVKREDVIIKRIVEGSIKIILELPYDKDIELAALFNRESSLISTFLHEFQVKDINLVSSQKSKSKKIQYPSVLTKPVKIVKPVGQFKKFDYSYNNFLKSIETNDQRYIAKAFEMVFKPQAIRFLNKEAKIILPFEINDFISNAFMDLLEVIKENKVLPLEEKWLPHYFLEFLKKEIRKFINKKKKISFEEFDENVHTISVKPSELGFYGLTDTDFEDKWLIVLRALSKLRYPCRKIIMMKYYLGFESEVIKERLNFKNTNSARNKSFECMKKLRKIIGEDKKQGITKRQWS